MSVSPPVFKIFVSSPSDVMVERRRVEAVVSRLNGEFAGAARLETLRWETEFYRAHATFQTQIARAADCDIVVGILKWRLGTPLPPEFSEHLPSGDPYPSGTAFEILSAVAKRQAGGELPDVFVFRYASSSPPLTVEDPNRERIERDWQAVKGFFQQWFLGEGGTFKAAFNPYVSEDDFEAQLERLLRKWLAEKVSGGRALRWPIKVKGSPFRGLDSFGVKHAPVFFGRAQDAARAIDLWREAGARATPFLLLIGASGAGKSSLARAGLIPRLTTPGVIPEVDLWRVASTRPSDSSAGPFEALAAALMRAERDLPKEDEGRGAALPEIAEGDFATPAELAAALRHADAVATRPVLNALARVAVSAKARETYQRDLRCDLVLLIDQFDELFAASIPEADRAAFIALAARLVDTGRVWLVVTLRADLYARMLEQPDLKALKQRGATYDLSPPDAGGLAEIVRAPAEAAGISYERDPAGGGSLDARILRDADRHDMLPLVQLALSRLFEARETIDGRTTLSLKAYESLGGLQGIVDEVGEKAIAGLEDIVKARLPRLLRQLAVSASGGEAALTIRSAPLALAAPDEPSRRLVDALTEARLLTTSAEHGGSQVRLAHQRVLEDWARARAIVAESGDFYRVRGDIEESRRKWEAGGRRGELLLARGLPLAEAESVSGKYADELTAEALAFVKASRARANRSQMIAWTAAALFAFVAIGAGFAAKVAVERGKAAETARASAETNRAQAESARHQAESARALAEAARKQAEARRAQSSIRLAVADELLADSGKGEQLRQCLGSTVRINALPPPKASRDFMVGRWHVDQEIGSTDVEWRKDGVCVIKSMFGGAGVAFDINKDVCTWDYEALGDNSFAITYRASAINNDAAKRLEFKILSPTHIYNPELKYDAFRIVCPAEELERDRAELVELRRRAEANPTDVDRAALVSKLDVVSFIEIAQKDFDAGAKTLREALQLNRALAAAAPPSPKNARLRATMSIESQWLAFCEGQADDTSDAKADYREAVAFARGVVDTNPDEPGLKAALALALYREAMADPDAAHNLIAEALGITEKLESEGKLTLEQKDWPETLREELAKRP